MSYPPMVRIRQQFERPRIPDVSRAIREALEPLGLERIIRPGETVALTAGSRGIANIPIILQAVVRFLRDLGARPFLVPAMGSHGGATAEGQRHILESYGITEAAVQAPIEASMEVVSLGETAEGFPVVLDRHAAEADHIGVVARVKPHTRYYGPIESGLMKMMMIGLGKHAGAVAYHRILLEFPFDQVVRSVGRIIRAGAPIAFGLAVVENAYDETARVEGVLPEDFETREEELLVLARRWLAGLPVRQADLLIIDEIGKDISGSGMDTNVVGRKMGSGWRVAGGGTQASGDFPGDQGSFLTLAPHHPPPATRHPLEDQPTIRKIFVRGLSARTHGNASGIGLADFTTTRLIQAMNYRATVINCLTAGHPEGAFLPVYFDTDREVLEAALAIIGTRPPELARVLRIRNTLSLEEVDISEPCLEDQNPTTPWTVLGKPQTFAFDPEGNLASFLNHG